MKENILKLTLEHLADDLQNAVVTAWRVSENDTVKKGEDLLEIVTDKASFDVSSPCGGRLLRILKEPGSSVRAGEIMAEIIVTDNDTQAGI